MHQHCTALFWEWVIQILVLWWMAMWYEHHAQQNSFKITLFLENTKQRSNGCLMLWQTTLQILVKLPGKNAFLALRNDNVCGAGLVLFLEPDASMKQVSLLPKQPHAHPFTHSSLILSLCWPEHCQWMLSHFSAALSPAEHYTCRLMCGTDSNGKCSQHKM